MKNLRKLIVCGLALAMTTSITACTDEVATVSSGEGNVPSVITSSSTNPVSVDPDENAATDAKILEANQALYEPDGKAGRISVLSHYDITKDQKGIEQCKMFLDPNQFGGEIEWITAPDTPQPFLERLATLVASDDSADICIGGWSNPSTACKGMFEPLDEYIDLDTPLWKDMKEVVDNQVYKGKHYYYPHRLMTSFALNYSQTTIEENNLEDPYELYKKGEWTWDAWRNIMTDFVNKNPDENIGFYGTDTIFTSLIATTGTVLVKVNPDGTIDNNIGSSDVSRAMLFYEDLYRSGLTYADQYGGWVHPATWAKYSDKILFEGMEPEWTYTAYAEALQNPKGVDNDIFDTVSDMRFVPFPRDTEADAYYQANSTFGFVVPRGAKNIKGAVDFINCFRVYDADPVMLEKDKQAHVHPDEVTFTEGRYAGSRKWTVTWDEDMYDLWVDMRDTTKFKQLEESAFGFEFWGEYGTMIADVVLRGESWTQTSTSFAPVIDNEISKYA